MANRAMIPAALTAFCEGVALQEGKRFKFAMLFGSHARGDDAEDSDVDVAIIFTKLPNSFIDTKLALAGIAYDVLLETGVLIQPMPLSEDEWMFPTHHPNPALVENIRRDGKPVRRSVADDLSIWGVPPGL